MAFEIENGVLKKYTEEQGITEVVIPDSVTSIGNRAFYGCSSLTEINIPDSVTSIEDSAFYECRSLKSITIPDSVTSIGYMAFEDCFSLESVVIPDSVTSIGDRAFYDCLSLESITIGNSVTSIGYRAFYGCLSLESITIGNSVTSIGKRAFYGCKSLSSVTIPDSVTSIGEDAFFGCSSLESIKVSEDNKNYASIDGVLYNKDITELVRCPQAKKEITIPDSVTSIVDIVDRAFYKCSSLESIICKNIKLDYKKISSANVDIEDVLNMIAKEDFAVKMAHSVKYDVLCAMYCADYSSEAFDAYFKKNFTKIFKFAIDNGNTELVKKVSENKKLLTKRNINNLIEYAREKNQLEISSALLSYKNENIGFDDPLKDFRL